MKEEKHTATMCVYWSVNCSACYYIKIKHLTCSPEKEARLAVLHNGEFTWI